MSDTSPFLTFQQKAKIGIVSILLTLLLLGAFIAIICAPASAIEINPSVETMPWTCQYSITKFLCDMDKSGAMGPQGAQGPAGINGTNNFSAMYWNSSNFTSYQNLSTFINSSYFNVTSNYTVFEGATVNLYNSSVNESYAYLPGREGGQTLNGGTTSGNLVLNGSLNNGNVMMQPYGGGYVLVGQPDTISTYPFVVNGSGGFNIARFKSDYDSGGVMVVIDNNNLPSASSLGETADLDFRWNDIGSTRIMAGKEHDFTSTAKRSGYLSILNRRNGSLTEVMRYTAGGFVGVGTSIPTSQFHTTGTVRFQNFGAGTATFDAGGNITSVSDSKYKTAVKPYISSLAQVNSITPKQWKYSASSGLDTQNYYSGFIAQEVEAAGIPAVFTKEDVKYVQEVTKANGEDITTTREVKTGTTTKSIDDRALIATLWNALKEEDAKVTAQQKEIDELKARLDKAKL